MDPLVVVPLWVCLILLILVLVGIARPQNQDRGAIRRIEAKLDLLLSQSGLAYDPLANVPDAVADAIQRGEKIQAIKAYRDATGVGLKEAKDFVEELQAKSGKD